MKLSNIEEVNALIAQRDHYKLMLEAITIEVKVGAAAFSLNDKELPTAKMLIDSFLNDRLAEINSQLENFGVTIE